MNIVKQFIREMLALPKNILVWLGVLMVVNMIIPLIFFVHFESKLILIAFMINFITGVILYKNYGFTRILGLMHWAWIPLIIFLIFYLNSEKPSGLYSIWINSVILLNGISLLFDIKDSIGYFCKEKEGKRPL